MGMLVMLGYCCFAKQIKRNQYRTDLEIIVYDYREGKYKVIWKLLKDRLVFDRKVMLPC